MYHNFVRYIFKIFFYHTLPQNYAWTVKSFTVEFVVCAFILHVSFV